MDGNAANTSTEIQQPETTAAGTTAAPELVPETDAASEKVSTLQKFIDGLFGGKKTEPENSAEPNQEEASKEKTAAAAPETKSYTEADMSSAVEAAKQKWLEEQAEAERLKGLPPAEQAKEEQKKKDAELSDLKSQLLQRELKDKAVAALEKEGYPVKLAETLNYSSQAQMEKSLTNTMEIFKDSLKAAISTKLRGKTPEGLGGAASAENMIKDQIAKNIRGGMI